MSNSNNKQQGSGGGSAPAGAAAAAPAAGAPPAAATGSAPVATPSTGSLASSPASWCVGCQITLSTTLGEVSKRERATEREQENRREREKFPFFPVSRIRSSLLAAYQLTSTDLLTTSSFFRLLAFSRRGVGGEG